MLIPFFKRHKLRRPSFRITFTAIILLAILFIGAYTVYFHAWFDGSLKTAFPNIPFDKVNKVAKLLQYLGGFTLLFEIVKFNLFVSEVAATYNFFASMNNIRRKLLGILSKSVTDSINVPDANVGEEPKKFLERLNQQLVDNTNEVIKETQDSDISKRLDRLSKKEISELSLKKIAFGTFAIASAFEIFTG